MTVAIRGRLLAVQGLSMSFGGAQVLESVNAQFPPGMITAIVGPNGSGKSTLAKIIAGYIRQDSGFVSLGGDDVDNSSPAAARRQGIMLVGQEDAVFPNLSVAENISVPAAAISGRWGFRLPKNHRDLAKEALSSMGKKDDLRLDQLAGTLSGGQRKALALARIYHAQPGVVIFDEATNSLGHNESRWLCEEISRLGGNGTTILLISHNPADVISSADRVVSLRKSSGDLENYDARSLSFNELIELLAGHAASKRTLSKELT